MLGKRVVAAIIDLVILAVLFVVMSVLSGDAELDTSDGASFSANLDGLPALVFFALTIAYYIGTEFYWAATPGKKAMGLKVVSDDGPITLGAVILRNVLRIIDGLPVFYLVGFICAAVRPDNKRLGDIVAKTSVVAA